jgi:hypothetical protein
VYLRVLRAFVVKGRTISTARPKSDQPYPT